MKVENILLSFSYKSFRKLADDLASRLVKYNDTIYIKSGIPIYFNAYIATTIFLAILTFITVTTISFFISLRYTIINALLFSVLLGIITSGFVIVIMLVYPFHRLTSDSRVINSKLLDVVIFMTAIAQADPNIDHIMNVMAESIEVKPFKRIFLQFMRNKNMLGMDSITALKEIRKTSPSIMLALLLDGLANVALTSGNIKDYLISESRRLLGEKRDRLKRLTNTLSFLSETYISLMVVLPVILIIILAFMSILGGTVAGLPPSLLIGLLTFVFIPFSSISLIIIIDTILSEV